MAESIRNKTILFISPQFYGYEKIITDKFREAGASVIYYPEREDNIAYKVINNLSPAKLAAYQESYYLRLYTKIAKQHIDYLLVIRGFLMQEVFISKMRVRYPAARFIMHQWDSLINYNYEYLMDSFDKVFSFDPKDCKEHSKLKYLPNFYLPQYSEVNNKINTQPIYDISFTGWAYDNRIKLINELKRQLPQKKIYNYSYLPLGRYIINLIKGKRLKDIKTKSIPLSAVLKIVENSYSVLDIPDARQTGYTFRTIDAMAACKKLITTNPFIKQEKFYHPDNIIIIDENNPEIDPDFFEKPFKQINVEEYSLDNWVKTIFSN